MAAVDGLGAMVVQLGQAIRYTDLCVAAPAEAHLPPKKRRRSACYDDDDDDDALHGYDDDTFDDGIPDEWDPDYEDDFSGDA